MLPPSYDTYLPAEEESVMSNTITVALFLAIAMATYAIGMWVTRATNERGDEVLTGVVKGIPVSVTARWLMLLQWFAYASFLVGFLLIIFLGLLEMAHWVEEPRVSFVGYMCATMAAGGAVYWAVLGVFIFANLRSAIREAANA
jgi:hypothetical protein